MNSKPNVLSVTKANRNFSNAESLANEYGAVILTKRDKPRYMLVDLEKTSVIEMTDEEKIDFVARRILTKHRHVFEELAK